MKNLFLFVSFVCLAGLSHAQVRMALIGGPHSASVKEQNSIPGWETAIKPGYSARSGVNLGVLAEIPFQASASSGWFIHSGFNYMAKGRKFSSFHDSLVSVISDTISASHNLSINYIDIPLNVAYKFPLGKKARFLVSAGPYVGFFFSGKQSFETRFYSSNSFSNEEKNLEAGKGEGKIKTFDAGFNARAGFEIGNVLLTGFLSQGLTSFYTAGYDGTFKHRVRGVSLGIWLNNVKSPPKAPRDTDKDGVLDSADACPEIAGLTITHGCPDRDDDGIADNQDKCPEIPGTTAYQGCPVPDSDKDGINDDADACPMASGVVEFNGCPVPDSDGDGLDDMKDRCPTEPGLNENLGCPADTAETITKEVIEKVNFAAQNIFFTPSSEKLAPASSTALDEIVALLTRYPSYNLLIEGHTDASGVMASNKKLSRNRAESVKNYLTTKGIDPSRLQAEGYGSEKPMATNKTAAGRAINRRVELKIGN